MCLLRDTDLVSKVTGANPIVTGFPPIPAKPPGLAVPSDYYGPESPVQPASIDLHVGDIFIPGSKSTKKGSVGRPVEDIALGCGDTVVITSLEQLHLPTDLAAIGFPPAHLSFRGLLMTNPGHVDPGFVGHLRFAVMNVGKESITLRRNDPIVTMLFFQLAPLPVGTPVTDWATRHGGAPQRPLAQDQVDCLSKDYLDVSNRAETAATKAVGKSELSVKLLGLALPVVTSLLTGLIVGYFALLQPYNEVKRDLNEVRSVVGVKDAKSRLDDMSEIKRDLEEVRKAMDFKGTKSKIDELEKLQSQTKDLTERLEALMKRLEKAEPKPGGGK